VTDRKDWKARVTNRSTSDSNQLQIKPTVGDRDNTERRRIGKIPTKEGSDSKAVKPGQRKKGCLGYISGKKYTTEVLTAWSAAVQHYSRKSGQAKTEKKVERQQRLHATRTKG